MPGLISFNKRSEDDSNIVVAAGKDGNPVALRVPPKKTTGSVVKEAFLGGGIVDFRKRAKEIKAAEKAEKDAKPWSHISGGFKAALVTRLAQHSQSGQAVLDNGGSANHVIGAILGDAFLDLTRIGINKMAEKRREAKAKKSK